MRGGLRRASGRPKPRDGQRGMGVSPTIEQALQFHQQGRLSEAEPLYREALRVSPRDYDILHFFGVLKLQQGDAAEAAGLISKALELRPNEGDAIYTLSAALLPPIRIEMLRDHSAL